MTLRSRHRVKWFGALFVGITLIILAIMVNTETDTVMRTVLILIVGILFGGIGVFWMLPRSVTAAFDLDARRCQHQLCVSAWTRNRQYAFDDIAGVGLKQYTRDGGFTYMPTLFLADGSRVSLSTANGSALSYQAVLAEVCTATGLARHDE